MKVRVFGWAGGRPDRSACETFEGDDALGVVRAMMATPFAACVAPRDFMSTSLARAGVWGPSLPPGDEAAAIAYLAKLAEMGLSAPA
jgi:hypothetical protein